MSNNTPSRNRGWWPDVHGRRNELYAAPVGHRATRHVSVDSHSYIPAHACGMFS